MNHLPDNYIQIVSRLKEQIGRSRAKAALKVNEILLELYWEIGRAILEMQKSEGWGAKVIDRLSSDLKNDFPDFRGLSVRNLKYMVLFAKTYPEFGQQVAAQIQNTDNQNITIRQHAAAQLPWGHHQLLLDKITDAGELSFYVQKCVEAGWGRNILAEQIKSDLYKRQGNAITNFRETLPAQHSDLVQQSIKNPYLFDFLSLTEEMRERDLEDALIRHIKQFMLELGRGFAYVGRQKNLVVQGDDFFLDLLFYNYNIHCFVVFELKVGDFKPEYAGKLNFYVNAVNEQIKGTDDKPTIGVLLCKTPNETVVRYSLQGIESPIGVAEYQLSEALPKQLSGEMPSVEELEAEIEKESKELKKPSEKKLESIKRLMQNLNQPRVEEKRSPVNVKKIYSQVVIPLREKIKHSLAEIVNDFEELEIINWVESRGYTSDEEVYNVLAEKGESSEFRIEFRLRGFKPAGTKAFDIYDTVCIETGMYKYSFYSNNQHPRQIFIEKLYHEIIEKEEMNIVTEKFIEIIYEKIETELRRIMTST